MAPSSQKNKDADSQVSTSERWTVQELVKNVVQYMLIMQQKKIPMKKLEITKHAMNRQGPEFKEVMDEVTEALKSIFGVQLIAFKGINERVEDVTQGTFFMLVTNLKVCPLIVSEDIDCEHLSDMHLKVGLLRTILGSFFMLNRELDEMEMWSIMEKTEASELLCPRKEDMRKFLKQEFVDQMYIQRVETKGVDGSTFRYSWGLRAEVEVNKYQLLKSIAKKMKKNPYDFKLQFVQLMNSEQYSEEIQEDFTRLGEGAESRPSQPENRMEMSIQEQETQELELEDIPDSNCVRVKPQQSNSQRRKSRVVESSSDASETEGASD